MSKYWISYLGYKSLAQFPAANRQNEGASDLGTSDFL